MNPTCCGPVVRNSVMGKEFWVCKECKQEVFEYPTPLDVIDSNADWNGCDGITLYPDVKLNNVGGVQPRAGHVPLPTHNTVSGTPVTDKVKKLAAAVYPTTTLYISAAEYQELMREQAVLGLPSFHNMTAVVSLPYGPLFHQVITVYPAQQALSLDALLKGVP